MNLHTNAKRDEIVNSWGINANINFNLLSLQKFQKTSIMTSAIKNHLFRDLKFDYDTHIVFPI